ncbi:MAG: sortase domain-containing protein, partial [Nocardioidaceae bacterium]
VPPYKPSDKPGWYRYSPTPGQVGPSVIVGHVSSAHYGPGIFYRLGKLHTGDVVRVRRADGVTATFTVRRVASYPKASFPTKRVYGDIDHPGLRLITCGGDYDPEGSGYPDNTVVFASLTHTTSKES